MIYGNDVFNKIMLETMSGIEQVEINIFTEAKFDQSINENVTITVIKPGTSIKLLVRDAENAGQSGNVAQHGPSIKAVKRSGESISVILFRDKNGTPSPYLDPHVSNSMQREFKKEIKFCLTFAYKNFDDLIELWYCTDPEKTREIANRIRQNNKDLKFNISQ